ncbi:exodeoxyribonuclease V subunit beta [Alkalimarinus coralli]|uniref:exodeoxyribonuclease V subunit beta n=1 Tax=Alkalimarinus coralli TaxID=2935863 RepID=UPI00202B6E28|nr:exodeoxyribonuclease V subunit beta [Alkalimarinus coralli]
MSQANIQKLDAHSIPLYGTHLIEASAGTGKTFNITRIYLRLLLLRKLKVQNILVVTFTKAATEELKGRIDSELRDTLALWGQRESSDEFYRSIEEQVSAEQAGSILRTAIGDLDEASIFTIHGFCKRVLSQHAFESGLPFDLEMEINSYEIKLDAVRDWYRSLNPDDYLDITEYWLTPEIFTDVFRSLLGTEQALECNSPGKVIEAFKRLKNEAKQALASEQALVFQELINSHKDSLQRTEEYNDLIEWLASDELGPMPKRAASVFDGKRYARKAPAVKEPLNSAFTPLKELKQAAAKIEGNIHRAKVDEMVKSGIADISKRIIERKKLAASMDFDDLVSSLSAGLSDHDGKALAAQLINQYPVALVDEFQDTDPAQYAIFDKIYCNPEINTDEPSALYMIGDPKQAIYGFRGGDVFAYLTARDQADVQWFMDTNWRSSSKMIEAYNRLFWGQTMGEADDHSGIEQTTHVFRYGIGYSPVKSAPVADSKPISKIFEKAMKYVYFPEHEDYGKGTNNQQFRSVIADWCAGEIQQLLAGQPLTDNVLQQDQSAVRSVEEKDIAVLVRDRIEAEEIQLALSKRGCSAVYLSNRENVFLSIEASELLTVLLGILMVEDDRMLTAALATRLCGFNSQQLLRLQEDEGFWEDCRLRFVDLRNSWARKGLMASLFNLMHNSFKPDPQRHERSLTNTMHLLELLQNASQRYRQPWELINWFREKIDAPTPDSESELRLESDENLIQIITLHGSKGLEYPVVFVPFATRAKGSSKVKPAFITYHDVQTRQAKTFIGHDPAIYALSESEREAEDVRLLYVAVTRAKYACYIGATPFSDYYRSPLGLMLGLGKDDDLLASLSQLIADTPQSAQLLVIDDHSVEPALTRNQLDEAVGKQADRSVVVQKLNHEIENDWWISSFSALTRNVRHGVMAEPDRDNTELSAAAETDSKLALRFALKKGAAAGNLLHDVLEVLDFQNPAWSDALTKPLVRFGELCESEEGELTAWLSECLEAKLSPGLALNMLPIEKTLREVEFYFPVEHASRVELGAILKEHRESSSFPLLPEGPQLRGMMHGFIDLVFEWEGKYYVADYKSTFLGDNLDDYIEQNLTINIQDNYYDLQYLIYSLALHRYLKLKIDNYTPETHFGGVYYLYLRGMSCSSNTGVYYSPIGSTLLDRMERLFEKTGADKHKEVTDA